jgi:N-methylhydantoinase A
VDQSAPAAVRSVLQGLREALEQRFRAIDVAGDLRFAHTLQMRFVGQAFEVDVPLASECLAGLSVGELREQFDLANRLVYMDSGGAGLAGKNIEVVGFRVGATALEATLSPGKPAAQAARPDRRLRILENRESRDCALTSRPRIEAAGNMAGPLLVEDETATIYVPPGWQATCDHSGNLILSRTGERA